MIINGWEGTSVEPVTYRLKDFRILNDVMIVKDEDGENVTLKMYYNEGFSFIHLPYTDYLLIPFNCLFGDARYILFKYQTVLLHNMPIVKKNLGDTVKFPTQNQAYDILHYFPRIAWVNNLFLDGIEYNPENERHCVFVLPIEGGKDVH